MSLLWGQCDKSMVAEGPGSGKDVNEVAGMDGEGCERFRGRVRTHVLSAVVVEEMSSETDRSL